MRFFKILTLALFLSSCGYTFQGSGSILPPDIQKVAIPISENFTSQPGVALQLTESLRDRFDRYGVITVVDKVSEADAVLNSKVLKISQEARSVTSNTEQALQYETIMTIAAELKRTTGPVLWRNPEMMISKDYGSTSDVVVTSSADFASGSLSQGALGALDNREVSRGQEAQALESLAEEAARRIYNEAVTPDF
ncbi:MAG: LPS assembly lipoprotein LptE [Bdellovibrionota bacterium]